MGFHFLLNNDPFCANKLFVLQALDEEYLKVDAQFGGVDQRKIFTLAEKVTSCSLFIYFCNTIGWSEFTAVVNY